MPPFTLEVVENEALRSPSFRSLMVYFTLRLPPSENAPSSSDALHLTGTFSPSTTSLGSMHVRVFAPTISALIPGATAPGTEVPDGSSAHPAQSAIASRDAAIILIFISFLL